MIEALPTPPCKSRRIALAVLAALSCLAVPISPPAVAATTVQLGDRSAYVLLAPGPAGGSVSSMMSGSVDDLRRARSLRTGGEGLLYVRQGGAAYVIRDAATLRQAQGIFGPQQALGAKQAELGRRQAALGRQQAQLGAEQAQVGLQQARSSRRGTADLGGQMATLGRRQAELGRQQGTLGREQGVLGQEQAGLSRVADAKFRALVAEALQRGVAQRID